nr:MAG TPA: hypothetical protein [Caudoviricetes sp.]
MNNTIILLKGKLAYSVSEYKEFSKGDTIWGDTSNPEELRRWDIRQIEEAKAELAKYNCSYTRATALYWVEEYALEYCECDEDGEFVQGSDFDLAKEKKEMES